MVKVIGPRSKHVGSYINTTSRSSTWSIGLSPFYLGPLDLYGDFKARNMENAWQYSKVYPSHVDSQGNPTQAYWDWAERGWTSTYAQRYPMGKGAIPLYSLWNGKRLTYIEARKEIYIPLYSSAVRETEAFKLLQETYQEQKEITLWDFDGYDHRALRMSYEEVINCPTKKMGHAFVLAMMLEGHI